MGRLQLIGLRAMHEQRLLEEQERLARPVEAE